MPLCFVVPQRWTLGFVLSYRRTALRGYASSACRNVGLGPHCRKPIVGRTDTGRISTSVWREVYMVTHRADPIV